MIGKSDLRCIGRLLHYEKIPTITFFLLISALGFIADALSKMGMADLPRWLERAYFDQTDTWITITPLYVIAITMLHSLGYVLSHYFMNKLARNIIKKLRDLLLANLLIKKQSFYDKQPPDSLLSILVYHVEQVHSCIATGIISMAQESITVLFLLGYLFFLNWQLTCILLIVVPIGILIIRLIAKRFYRISKKIQLATEGFSQSANEMLRAIQLIRLYSGSSYQSRQFHHLNQVNYTQNLKLKLTELLSVPVLRMLVALMVSGMIWLVISDVNLGNFASFGSFTAYITTVILIGQPIQKLSSVTSVIQKGIAAAERVFEYLDNPEKETDNGIRMKKAKGSIVFANVSKSYGEKTILKNINLTIQPNQVTAIVGPSGSGKTTLTYLLLQFYKQTEGIITIDGYDIRQVALSSLRKNFSVVSQTQLFFNDTLAKNIAYAEKTIDKQRLINAAENANASEFIKRLPQGFDTPIGYNGSLLSGGQRQRIAVARAFYRDAPILILDEATSSLDNLSDQYIQRAVRKLIAKKTTIVIAHKLSNIVAADNIVVLDRGQIVQQGCHEQLIAQPGLYSSLYQNSD